MAEATIPGTNLTGSRYKDMFARYEPLIKATDGLTLSQVCAITGLETSTIQNWVKRRFVARPVNKKYRERQLARILLIASLRDVLKIDSIGELMGMVNGNADDESDDIISEEKMYDYFCRISKDAQDNEIKMQDIPQFVRQSLADYEAPDETAFQRLCEAMTTMVYAYTAAEYKKCAEGILQTMRNEWEADKL